MERMVFRSEELMWVRATVAEALVKKCINRYELNYYHVK